MTRPRYDMTELAAVVAKALQVGIPASNAVATHYRIRQATAQRLITAARSRGVDIPRLTRGPAPGSGRSLAEVAIIARKALADGVSTSIAVGNRYKLAPRSATRLISQARAAGHEIGYDTNKPLGWLVEARVSPPGAADMALSCVCGECFPLDVPALTRHTVQAHRRGPSVAERTPRKVAA